MAADTCLFLQQSLTASTSDGVFAIEMAVGGDRLLKLRQCNLQALQALRVSLFRPSYAAAADVWSSARADQKACLLRWLPTSFHANTSLGSGYRPAPVRGCLLTDINARTSGTPNTCQAERRVTRRWR